MWYLQRLTVSDCVCGHIFCKSELAPKQAIGVIDNFLTKLELHILAHVF